MKIDFDASTESLAKELFRTVHGPGDGGSEAEFYRQHPDQWLRFADIIQRAVWNREANKELAK